MHVADLYIALDQALLNGLDSSGQAVVELAASSGCGCTIARLYPGLHISQHLI